METTRGRLRHLGEKYRAFKPDHYYDHYETHLAVDPSEITSVLELGVHRGGSLRMWSEYFPQARIFGVDLSDVKLDPALDRIHLLRADQTDTASIGAFLRANGVESLDLIIDDCSHIGFLTKQSFWYLFDTFLKPGGLYVIEDWTTGYLENWPDGAKLAAPEPGSEASGIFGSHTHGIPGFAKQLIDRSDEMVSIVFTAAFIVVQKQSAENAAALERGARLLKERPPDS